jgi:hypothetical protein
MGLPVLNVFENWLLGSSFFFFFLGSKCKPAGLDLIKFTQAKI